uniref:Uncharacterized protein n=1 Tax=Knipowitschia caucasica TaxID=637954 RepID=A0AAV2KZ90_KNICA
MTFFTEPTIPPSPTSSNRTSCLCQSELYAHPAPHISPHTAPYGSTGSSDAPLACRYLVLALSSYISVY